MRLVDRPTRMLRWLLLMGVAAIAALLIALPVTAAPTGRHAADPLLVLISGCDGLVAEGGIPPNPWAQPPSAEYSFLTSYSEDWIRHKNDPLSEVKIAGTGFDADGARFTIVTTAMVGDFDTFGGGTVHVTGRRGSSLTGAVSLANTPIVLSPYYDRRALRIRAATCSLH